MSKVYYTDFRCRPDEGPADKLKRLIKAAGIGDIDMDGKFVAIKMHFGELGNMTFLRPNYARAVVDVVTELGGKPFLTDCNTLYPGSRKNALEHLWCAWQNGFTPLTVGCPVIIADGLKGTDDIAVPVQGGEYIKEAKIGHAVMDADVFISLTHFKGHEMTGFGGTIKNIGMGCGSRAGKKDQHSNGKPVINEDRCRGCRRCMRECANNGLVFDEERKKIMPVAKKYSIAEILKACEYYFEKSGRRYIFEYVLIEGENDKKEHADELIRLLKGKPCHVNLIRLNEVKERKLKAVTDKNAYRFLGLLERGRLSATLRRQIGADIDGACGQLRQKFLESGEEI